MEQIKNKYVHNGWSYKLIELWPVTEKHDLYREREQRKVAVYARYEGERDYAGAYEVHILRLVKRTGLTERAQGEGSDWKNPEDREWSLYGWTYTEKPEAEKKVGELLA